MKKSKEDYLSELYRLQSHNNRPAKVTELSKALSVSKPSVSEMIRKLANAGLVKFKPRQGIFLTKNGVEEARKVVRKHQLLEVFFSNLLNIKDGFHKEAHQMEHNISDKATEKLSHFLRNPKVCPDNHPIPSKETDVIELDKLQEGKTAKILFSNIQDKQTISRLNALGMVPNANITLTRKISLGPLMILVKGSEIAIGKEICSNIFVEIQKKG
jgi:DtxR family Mn-dependent transcriptional regulator